MDDQLVVPKTGTIQALVAQGDGSMWVGFKGGIIDKYYQNGRFMKRWGLGLVLTCLCAVGDRVWAGSRDGYIVVLSSEVTEKHRWMAHESCVYSMVAMGGGVYTLAADGSIKCG